MIKKILSWFRPKRPQTAPAPRPDRRYAPRGNLKREPILSETLRARLAERIESALKPARPYTTPGAVQDSASMATDPGSIKQASWGDHIPDATLAWFAAGGVLPPIVNALIAQHWLVDKACSVPARDAIAKGWEVKSDDDEMPEKLADLDRRYKLKSHLREFIHMGRVHGGRIAYFDIRSTDPDIYRKPFNIDAVTPGSYKGIVQVDADDCVPMPTHEDLFDASRAGYMEPTFWRLGQRIFHKSHLCIFVPHPVPRRLRASYRFFGVSVPQRVFERVYGAERTANEAPLLAMTKRLTVLNFGEDGVGDHARIEENLAWASLVRDNHGVMIGGAGDTYSQLETSLTDLDTTIMVQYQSVAAAACMPATKLLETSPKGMDATGEAEAENYRDELKALQENDLEPIMLRHYMLLARSEGLDLDPVIRWNALDNPTESEWAEINLKRAQVDAIYVDRGVLSPDDIYNRLRQDENGDYHSLEGERDENEEITGGLGIFAGGGNAGNPATVPRPGAGSVQGGA